jgi:aryl-alcohol dehydrogenase-like predicted oxidoreductase
MRRQDEPELMAMCADTGVGLVPYSPQGKGRLARPWGEQSTRSSVDHVVQGRPDPARSATWPTPFRSPGALQLGRVRPQAGAPRLHRGA